MNSKLNNRPIGVFDSGVGGLTVLKQLYNYLPHESYIYLGDLARVPYGTKSNSSIIKYTKQACAFFIKEGVKCIVIACNTASSISLHYLEELDLGIPIIGVIKPGAHTAALATETNKIVIIATEATVNSNSYVEQIHNINKNITVLSKSCPLLIPLAEEGWSQDSITQDIIKKYTSSLFSDKQHDSKSADCLLLGCTHFPILLEDFKKVLPSNIKIIDSAEATAKNTKEILEKNNLISNNLTTRNKTTFFITDNPERFYKVANIFIKETSLENVIVTDIDI